MAILQGFPPSNTISPSVRIAEADLSFIAPAPTFSNVGLVGFASKGPINSPTLVSTQRQLNTAFGYPHPAVGDPYLIYAASQVLLVANTVYVCRVADVDPVSDEQATTASANLLAAGDIINIFSNTPGPFTLTHDSFFRWKLNGVINHRTLVVTSDANRASPNAGQPWSVVDIVAELNSQIDSENDGVTFYVHGTGGSATVGFKSVWAYGPNATLELMSVQDALYPHIGLGTGMTVAEVTGTVDRYPNNGYTSAGTYNFTGLTNMYLNVVVDGTDNAVIDEIVQVVDLSNLEGSTWTTSQVVNEINTQITGLPGGFVATAVGNNIQFQTYAAGEDSRMLVKSDSTAATILGLPATTAVGGSPTGVTGDAGIYTFGIVEGSENSTGEISMTITADSTGIEGNNTTIVLVNDTVQGTFKLAVFNNGVQLESWGNLTKDQSSSFYVETYIALVSDFVRVVDNTAVGAPPADTGLAGIALTGGSDGIPSDPDKQDELLVGSSLGYTGIYCFSEPEQIDIDLLAVPGHASTTVVLAMLDLCQNVRQDCLAIVDPPFGLTASEVVSWQNGSHPLNLTRFDSDFGALYWPWVKIFDSYNGVDVWCPPSGSVMAAIARSDFLSAPWFAPAGINRGVVPGISDVFNRPTLAERDTMYGNRNCVNPIVQFVDVQGFVIWGQKTLQRLPSALDRVNVRRLLFLIEKEVRIAARSLLFDPNDDLFRTKFVQLVSQILTEIQIGRGIHAYIIDAGVNLNTNDTIDRNEFHAQIGIQPTKSVEFMFIEFSINRTGSFAQPDNTTT